MFFSFQPNSDNEWPTAAGKIKLL